jgi:8-oxo-dGTP pyrophosphatase MutT (NUDIX family)
MTAPRRFDESYLDWLADQRGQGTPLIPAGTVVLLRDHDNRLEVLLLRRNTAVEFAGGLWVFPGGRIDPEDHPSRDTGHDDLLVAARNACVREALEEADQLVDVDSLVWFAHWSPPAIAKKRFATFFFACRSAGGDVTIDGSEIHDHQWISPAGALARHRAREVDLAPPTWVTLHYLAQAPDVDHALDRFRRSEPRFYETHVARDDDTTVFLWEPDAGYDTGDLTAPGPRHRIVARPGSWELDDSGLPFPS